MTSGCEDRARALREFLRTRRFGRHLHWYERVASTNDLAAVLAADGAPEGTLVVAEAQDRGRGRGPRHWFSPPGLGIYLSLVLRPRTRVRQLPLHTFLAATALTEVLRDQLRLPAEIRWPNDILVGGRKAAGILAEGRSQSDGIRELIIGVGINLHHRQDDFPSELRDHATSLAAAGAAVSEPVRVLAFLLEAWEKWYEKFEREGPQPLLKAWSGFSPESNGARVKVRDGEEIRTGRSRGVDADGALLIEDERGVVSAVRFGEIRAILEVGS
jgi:BirA family biotin operon repressor/biotin-[acetyl-CoA-carboxylase] ligase